MSQDPPFTLLARFPENSRKDQNRRDRMKAVSRLCNVNSWAVHTSFDLSSRAFKSAFPLPQELGDEAKVRGRSQHAKSPSAKAALFPTTTLRVFDPQDHSTAPHPGLSRGERGDVFSPSFAEDLARIENECNPAIQGFNLYGGFHNDLKRSKTAGFISKDRLRLPPHTLSEPRKPRAL